MTTRDPFYSRWIVANAMAEGIGLGGTLLIAHFVIGSLDAARPGTAGILLGALLAVAMGTVLEGSLVGWAQAQVLARRTPRVTLGIWTLATSIGAALAWVLGMLPSTLAGMMLQAPSEPLMPAAPVGPPLWMMLLFAAVLGLLLGPVLAFPQWRVLRRFAPDAARWFQANAAAWAVGMVLVVAGMHLIAWTGSVAGIVAGVAVTCTLTGAVVGAIHGRVLRRMLDAVDGRPHRRPRGEPSATTEVRHALRRASVARHR